MSRQRISRVYLFAQGRDAQYIPTGVLSFGDDQMYRFGYAKSWLASRDAFPIDPINLPLTDATYRDQYLWSCFDDAMSRLSREAQSEK